MSDEVLKVLSMLENGTITSSEAEKLLDALGSSKQKQTRVQFPKKFFDTIEKIPDVINKKIIEINNGIRIARDLEEMEGPVDREFSSVEAVSINQSSGDLIITASDTDRIHLKTEDSILKTTHTDKSLSINISSGDAVIEIPKEISLSVESFDGDVHLTDFVGSLSISIYSGDLVASSIGNGKMSIVNYNGDTSCTINDNISGSISSFNGDMQIELPNKSDMKIIIEQINGDFVNNTDYDTNEYSVNVKKIITGEATEKLVIKTFNGDVCLSKSIINTEDTNE